ncbi:MAG: DUF1223 domain-containing protein [Chitinophagaceae bacterium]
MNGKLKFGLILPIVLFHSYTIPIVETNSYEDKQMNRVLIELFTSEGCSSCPAADEAVASLAAKYKGQLFVLGFHVDYWNKLGWKDVYSNLDYTERQRDYAAAFSLNSIYTPQVVINGHKEFVGSSKKVIDETIATELRKPLSYTIKLIAQETKGRMIEITYSTTGSDATDNLNIALVQLEAITNVKRGENSGKILAHINIVRMFKTIDFGGTLTGRLMLTLPSDLSFNECKLIAFTQNKINKFITGITEASVLP